MRQRRADLFFPSLLLLDDYQRMGIPIPYKGEDYGVAHNEPVWFYGESRTKPRMKEYRMLGRSGRRRGLKTSKEAQFPLLASPLQLSSSQARAEVAWACCGIV